MSSNVEIDHSEIQSVLGSIGLSAALIFGATLLSQGIGFLTRITMARYLSVDGYGNITIGLAVLNLFGIAALAGMPTTMSRYLPRHETPEKRRRTLATGFQIVGFFSLALATGIFLLAESIATFVFGNVDLVWIIRIFSGVMPFYAVLKLSLGGFRGYGMTTPRVITQNVLRPGLQLAGIILFVSIGFGTEGIAFAYGAGFVLVAVIAVALLFWLSEFSAGDMFSWPLAGHSRKLLAFSLPLAASGAVNVIAKQSDLVLLGIFRSSSLVGTYEIAFRLAMFTYVLFGPAVGYLFQPIISRFEADDQDSKMGALYTVATRWVIIGSFPAIVLFILFPDQTLRFFFDERYVGGSPALRILVVGFTIALLPGLTTNFLSAVGQTKLVFYLSGLTMAINVLVNFALIPFYGIIGAAVATASAQAFNNFTSLYFIHRNYGVHPFARRFVLPTAMMTGILALVVMAPLPLESLTFFQGFVVAAAFSFGYLSLFFVTRSIYDVELALIDALLQKIGLQVQVSDRLEFFVR